MVCKKTGAWIGALTSAVNGILTDGANTLTDTARANLVDILAQDPTTSEP
jgi:hypothetical protein